MKSKINKNLHEYLTHLLVYMNKWYNFCNNGFHCDIFMHVNMYSDHTHTQAQRHTHAPTSTHSYPFIFSPDGTVLFPLYSSSPCLPHTSFCLWEKTYQNDIRAVEKCDTPLGATTVLWHWLPPRGKTSQEHFYSSNYYVNNFRLISSSCYGGKMNLQMNIKDSIGGRFELTL